MEILFDRAVYSNLPNPLATGLNYIATYASTYATYIHINSKQTRIIKKVSRDQSVSAKKLWKQGLRLWHERIMRSSG